MNSAKYEIRISERRGVAKHRRYDRLLFFFQVDNKENIKVPNYWIFVRGIHRWPEARSVDVRKLDI